MAQTTRAFEEALRDAAKRVLLSYLVAILGAVVFVVFIVILFLGVFAVAEIEGGFGEGLGETLTGLSITIIIVIAVIALLAYALFVAAAYLYYKAYSGLRSALPNAPENVRASLELPVTILYYSALLMLVGAALSIILIGLILLVPASLGATIGNILLGLSLRNIGAGLETAGTLLIIASALQIASLLPYLGVLAMIGFILEIVAYYIIYTWRGSFQAPNHAGTPTPAPGTGF